MHRNSASKTGFLYVIQFRYTLNYYSSSQTGNKLELRLQRTKLHLCAAICFSDVMNFLNYRLSLFEMATLKFILSQGRYAKFLFEMSISFLAEKENNSIMIPFMSCLS